MRIACVHLPSVAIQAAVRLAPHLGGQPLGLVTAGSGAPRLGAVSRLAHAAGARPGMTVLEARAICPDLQAIPEDPAAVHRLFAGLADALSQLAGGRVQIDPVRGVLCELPAGTRGTSFGERLHDLAGHLGLVSRVGIADDVFTAWAATQAVPRVPVRCVPSGGASAFLANLPLELLPLDSEVLHTLEILGVRRLGAFAQLPAPSVGRKWSAGTLDLQALARGDGPVRLSPTAQGAVAEGMALSPPVTDGQALGFLLLPLAERVCLRLEGRKRVAQAMRLTVTSASNAAAIILEVEHQAGSAQARTWLDLFRARLCGGNAVLAHPAIRLELEVLRESVAVEVALDLFARAAARVTHTVSAAPAQGSGARAGSRRATIPPAPSQASMTTGKLSASRRPVPARRSRESAPGLFDRDRQAPAMGLRVLPMPTPEPGTMRVVEPPQALASQGELPSGAPETIVFEGVAHKVVHALGPTRLEAPWAPGTKVSRDYWEVSFADGKRLWVFRDRVAGGLYLAGVLA